ncbi:MAG: hypothetical protein LRY38_01490 [Aeromonadaceae bacterium]|nr:hypothetical protein [Aeromonadaceae bacterium]
MSLVECQSCHNLIEHGTEVCDSCGKRIDGGGSVAPAQSSIPHIARSASGRSSSKEDLIRSMQQGKPTTAMDLLGIVLAAAALVLAGVGAGMINPALPYILFGVVFPLGVAGFYVGRRTGNAASGALWASLLGPAGLVVAFVLPDRTRVPCLHCKELIKLDAKICPHCQRES